MRWTSSKGALFAHTWKSGNDGPVPLTETGPGADAKPVMGRSHEPATFGDSRGSGNERLSGGWRFLIFVAVLGCLPALLAGWAVDWAACENEGTAACDRQDVAHVQFWLAVAGVGLVAWMVVSAIRRRFTETRILVVCALVLYAVWAVLNDAAVHGWGLDMLLIP